MLTRHERSTQRCSASRRTNGQADGYSERGPISSGGSPRQPAPYPAPAFKHAARRRAPNGLSKSATCPVLGPSAPAHGAMPHAGQARRRRARSSPRQASRQQRRSRRRSYPRRLPRQRLPKSSADRAQPSPGARPSVSRILPPGRASSPRATPSAVPCSRRATSTCWPPRPSSPASSRRPGSRRADACSRTSSRDCRSIELPSERSVYTAGHAELP